MKEILELVTYEHMVFVFLLVFIVIFRRPLSDLINRVTSIDRDGLKAEPSPESQREKTETTSEAVQQLLRVVGDSIVINELEESIYKELKEKGLSCKGDTVKILVKHLSGARLLLEFERIHNLIFGSQIYLLKKLNEAAGQGIKFEYVVKYVEERKKEHQGELGDWTVDQYLTFLRSELLITNEEDLVHITNLGVEYITWIVRNGRKEQMPL